MSDFLEKDLEDLIFENRDSVVGRGLPNLHSTLLRQFRLPSGVKNKNHGT